MYLNTSNQPFLSLINKKRYILLYKLPYFYKFVVCVYVNTFIFGSKTIRFCLRFAAKQYGSSAAIQLEKKEKLN